MLLKIFLVILLLAHGALGHLLTIEPAEEECFFEKLDQGVSIKFMFEVIDGGKLDIDLTIRDPSNSVIHVEHAKGSGNYKIQANQAGVHSYCFGNINSSQESKILLFNIDHIEKPKVNSDDHDKLNDMITELTALMSGIKHEMDFFAARDRLHFHINEKINSRVVTWSFFEFILLVAVALAQTYYTKRFFETRRAV